MDGHPSVRVFFVVIVRTLAFWIVYSWVPLQSSFHTPAGKHCSLCNLHGLRSIWLCKNKFAAWATNCRFLCLLVTNRTIWCILNDIGSYRAIATAVAWPDTLCHSPPQLLRYSNRMKLCVWDNANSKVEIHFTFCALLATNPKWM